MARIDQSWRRDHRALIPRRIRACMHRLLPFALAFACVPAFAAEPTREHFAPRGLEASYHDWHYTPVIKVGSQVIVSGIPAAGPGSYEDQVRGMFESLRRHLESAGASLADVVELTSLKSFPLSVIPPPRHAPLELGQRWVS